MIEEKGEEKSERMIYQDRETKKEKKKAMDSGRNNDNLQSKNGIDLKKKHKEKEISHGLFLSKIKRKKRKKEEKKCIVYKKDKDEKKKVARRFLALKRRGQRKEKSENERTKETKNKHSQTMNNLTCFVIRFSPFYFFLLFLLEREKIMARILSIQKSSLTIVGGN